MRTPSLDASGGFIMRLVLPAVIGLLALASLRPLTRSVYMPMVDYPQHAYQVLMWYEADHDPAIGQHYRVELVSAYAATYLLWRCVMELGFPVEDAGRIVIGLGVIGLPLSFLLLLKARGRPPELTLLAFPVVYHHTLAYGFMAFYVSTMVFFLALAAYAAWIARPTRLRGWLAFASGLLVLFGHALAAGLYGLSAGLLAAFEPRLDPRRRALLLAPLVPIGLLLAAWTLSGRSILTMHGLNNFGQGFVGRMGAIPLYLCGGFTPTAQKAATPVIGLAALAGLLGLVGSIAAPAMPADHQVNAWRRTLAAHDPGLFAAGLAALVLYFAVPFDLANVSWVHGRFIVFAFLLLAASFARVPWRAARAGIGVVAAVIALSTFTELSRGFAMFAEDYGDARTVFSSLPRGATVCQPAGLSPNVADFFWSINIHLGLNVALHTRGYTSSWVGMPHLILRFRGDEQRLVPDCQLAASADHRTLMIRPTTEALADYLILHSLRLLPSTMPVVGRPATYRLARRTGNLWLYSRAGG